MKLDKIKDAILIWGIVSDDGLSILKNEKIVIVPETRPYLLGLLYNAPLLKKQKINFVYCTDNMLGFLFYKDKIKKTIIFYKKLTKKGIICISGSLYVALLSKLHNVAIKIMPQKNLKNIKFLDNSATTLAGKKFILKEDTKFFKSPKDELISYFLL